MHAEKIVPYLPPLPSDLSCATVPKWNLKNLRKRQCPTCNTDSPSPICTRPDKLQVHLCNKCGMVYLGFIPSEIELHSLYDNYSDYKGYSSSIKFQKKMSWLSKVKKAHVDILIAIIERYGLMPNKKICEIGASYGEFLQLARHKGSKVKAVEIDEKSCDFLEKELRISTYRQIKDLPESQDIICAKSVFEHLENPGEIIAEVHDKLHSDGMLLLSLPNGANFETIGHSWAGFRVDFEHLNYWSPKTLSEFLARFGFYVEQYWEINQLATARGEHKSVSIIKRILGYLLPKRSFDPFLVGKATLIVLARKAPAPSV